MIDTLDYTAFEAVLFRVVVMSILLGPMLSDTFKVTFQRIAYGSSLAIVFTHVLIRLSGIQ
jgi:hypothetical protein